MAVRALPQFLGEAGSRHFTLQFRCASEPRAHIVYVPPFGEEMNRCRALAAEQARKFAVCGYDCTLLDFFGTGDSEGELAEASLEQWRGSIGSTIETLGRERSVPVVLWGVRLGALIALDYTARDRAGIEKLLLWQPVTSGKRYINQLLRQRVASLANAGLPPETTAQIRARIAEAERVEISGYVVADPLISDIEGLSLPAESLSGGSILWMENVEQEEDELPSAAAKAVAALRDAGNDVQVYPFIGAPVWQLHKRDSAPHLLELTTSLFA